MKTPLLLLTLLTALPLNSHAAQAVEYSFIVPTKLAYLNNITELTITGLTNDQQISGTYKLGGQINYFFYDFKDKSVITLQGAKGLTAKDNTLPGTLGNTKPRWNKNGQAAGIYFDENERRYKGFIYANGEYTILGEPDDSLGIYDTFGFNNQGQVLVNYSSGNDLYFYPSDDPPVPFLTYFVYHNGTISAEPLPPHTFRRAANINNSGQIVGFSLALGAGIDGGIRDAAGIKIPA